MFATASERYRVGQLNNLWPQGFNSAYPGKPVFFLGVFFRLGVSSMGLPEPDHVPRTPDDQDVGCSSCSTAPITIAVPP